MAIKVISGGQTGADRAGLDVAVKLNLERGGWIPFGRKTEDGPLSMDLMKLYNLRIHASSSYGPRTEQNVKDGDGTILFGNMDSPGCKLTIGHCKWHGRPFLTPEGLYHSVFVDYIKQFIISNDIKILNIAGNRASTNPLIYQFTYDTLLEALS